MKKFAIYERRGHSYDDGSVEMNDSRILLETGDDSREMLNRLRTLAMGKVREYYDAGPYEVRVIACCANSIPDFANDYLSSGTDAVEVFSGNCSMTRFEIDLYERVKNVTEVKDAHDVFVNLFATMITLFGKRNKLKFDFPAQVSCYLIDGAEIENKTINFVFDWNSGYSDDIRKFDVKDLMKFYSECITHYMAG